MRIPAIQIIFSHLSSGIDSSTWLANKRNRSWYSSTDSSGSCLQRRQSSDVIDFLKERNREQNHSHNWSQDLIDPGFSLENQLKAFLRSELGNCLISSFSLWAISTHMASKQAKGSWKTLEGKIKCNHDLSSVPNYQLIETIQYITHSPLTERYANFEREQLFVQWDVQLELNHRLSRAFLPSTRPSAKLRPFSY